MSEIGTLEAIDATYGYLRRPGDASALVDSAAAFTRHAAWALRDRGWRNIRKTTGLERQGLDTDKIIHATTLEIIDIVVGAGAPGQRVGWQPMGSGTPGMIVDPQPPPGEGDGGGGLDQNDLAVLVAIRDELIAIRKVNEEQLELTRQVAGVLARAATRFL